MEDNRSSSESVAHNPLQPVFELIQGGDPDRICLKYGIDRAQLDRMLTEYQASRRKAALADSFTLSRTGRNDPCQKFSIIFGGRQVGLRQLGDLVDQGTDLLLGLLDQLGIKRLFGTHSAVRRARGGGGPEAIDKPPITWFNPFLSYSQG